LFIFQATVQVVRNCRSAWQWQPSSAYY